MDNKDFDKYVRENMNKDLSSPEFLNWDKMDIEIPRKTKRRFWIIPLVFMGVAIALFLVTYVQNQVRGVASSTSSQASAASINDTSNDNSTTSISSSSDKSGNTKEILGNNISKTVAPPSEGQDYNGPPPNKKGDLPKKKNLTQVSDVSSAKESSDLRSAKESTDLGSNNENSEVHSDKENSDLRSDNESTVLGSNKENSEVRSDKENSDLRSDNESTDLGSNKENSEVRSDKENSEVRSGQEKASPKARLLPALLLKEINQPITIQHSKAGIINDLIWIEEPLQSKNNVEKRWNSKNELQFTFGWNVTQPQLASNSEDTYFNTLTSATGESYDNSVSILWNRKLNKSLRLQLGSTWLRLSQTFEYEKDLGFTDDFNTLTRTYSKRVVHHSNQIDILELNIGLAYSQRISTQSSLRVFGHLNSGMEIMNRGKTIDGDKEIVSYDRASNNKLVFSLSLGVDYKLELKHFNIIAGVSARKLLQNTRVVNPDQISNMPLVGVLQVGISKPF
jgi:hypothetical protein